MPSFASGSSGSPTWDSISDLKSIPFGNVTSTLFSFNNSKPIASSIVYIECVEDDIGDSKTNVGQYRVGDRIVCPTLFCINNGSTTKVVNPQGGALTLPRSAGGDLADKISGVFTINTTNADKYKLRCFASHSSLPLKSARPFFDAKIPVTNAVMNAQIKKDGFITVPHTEGIAPDIVEINFIVLKAFNGWVVGSVIPLKHIGGAQPPLSGITTGVWTVSADKTNVYLGCSSTSILIASNDGKHTIVDLLGTTFCSMEVCIRKKYPNPYGVTFTEKAINTVNDMQSEKITAPTNSGEVLSYDMILINNGTGVTAFTKDEKIYLNQCGGSIKTNFSEVSRALTYDPKDRLVKLLSTPPVKDKLQFALYDRKTKKAFDVMTDKGGANWTYVFRWTYENNNTPYDIDTSWMTLPMYSMSEPHSVWASQALNVFNGKFIVSSVDILVRIRTDFATAAMPALSTWCTSSLKGGAQGETEGMIKAWNNFSITYDNTHFKINDATSKDCMTLPNYLSKGAHPTDSGLTFDNAIGLVEYRIVGYK